MRCERGKTVPISPLAVPPPFLFFEISFFSPVFCFIVPPSPLSWFRHACTVSLFSFHCVSQIFTHLCGHLSLERALSWFPWCTVPPALFSTVAQDERSWWTQEAKTGRQGRRQRSEPESEQAWWLAGLATVFWHLGDHKVHHRAEEADVRACQRKCEKSPPWLPSLVLRFLTLIAP